MFNRLFRLFGISYRKLILFIIILLVISLNPSFRDFEDFVGTNNQNFNSTDEKKTIQMNKPVNLLVFSVYKKSTVVETRLTRTVTNTYYLGLLMNFIKVSENEGKVE